MHIFFTEYSPYKNISRFMAMLWTLIIFTLCLIPGNELPNVNIPFVDKWVHLVLFGVFSFLWLASMPTANYRFLLIVFAITIFVGWLVEFVQGTFTRGRYQDNMDTLADTAGGLIGILIFAALAHLAQRKISERPQ
jgi:VanZ family protein